MCYDFLTLDHFSAGCANYGLQFKKANHSTYKAKIQAHPTPDGGIKVWNHLFYFREVYSLKKANRSTFKAKIYAHPTPEGQIKVLNSLLYFREAIPSWVCYDFLT